MASDKVISVSEKTKRRFKAFGWQLSKQKDKPDLTQDEAMNYLLDVWEAKA